jgi:hypothetical protein
MESYSLFGIPYPIIGFFCFILAAIFFFIWPKSKAKRSQTFNFSQFVLHYFHPLAWVLLGMAAFFQKNYIGTAIVTAGIGVVAMLMFIYIFTRN